jgi:hypothetical protein
MKKILFVMFMTLALVLTACGGDTPPVDDQAAGPAPTATAANGEPIPPRPEIQMTVLGETYDGLPGAYCWLQAANDIRCEPDPLDMQPDTEVEVTSEEIVTFTVASEAGTPAALYAVLLDDTDTAGDPVQVDFGAVDTGEYAIDLEPGTHRISIVAEFPQVEGDNSFVSSIFAVTLPEAVAEVPTATTPPTKEPDPTEAPTEIEEEEPTATEKPDPSSETEAEATEEPTADTAAVMEPTEEPTDAPTATPTTEPTEVPPTATPEPTAMPTQAPTAVPTVPPTPTLVPTEESGAPQVVVINGGRTFLPSGIAYCYREENGTEVCMDIPASAQSERVLVNNGDTIRLDAADGGPDSMTLILANSDQSEVFSEETLPGNSVSLYSISGEPGNYILQVDTVWPNATATYYFRLQIVG